MSNGTMSDLTIEVLKSIRDEVRGLRGEVVELRGEVVELRGEVGGLRNEVGDLRTEMRAGLAQVNGRLDNLIAISGSRYLDLERRVTALERARRRKRHT